MNRNAIIAAVVTISLVAFGTYSLKGEVKEVRQQADKTARDIHDIRKQTALLKAEWAYLSRPERLEELAGRYLTLKPLKVDHRAQVAELPVRFDVLEQEAEVIRLAEAATEAEAGVEAVAEEQQVVLAPATPNRRPRHTTNDRLSKSYASMDPNTRHAIANYARRALRPASYSGSGQ
ncbi:MAG: cell division protein FtsL [Alphaproteobacteria bacterium]